MFDFLVVGAGLFGSVFSRYAAEHGKSVLLIDKRIHLGGMCFSEKIEGINVHRYGPHIFHTDSHEIWEYVNRFSKFNNLQQRTKVNYRGTIYSFPINLMTLHQLWGVCDREAASKKLEEVRLDIKNPANLEEWVLSQVGQEIYEIFIKGYTEKQWGRSAKELPSSIIKRLPIRLTYDDRYFSDTFQGIPEDGYTRMFENILDHENIRVQLGVDFFDNPDLRSSCKQLVYSGKIDEFFNFKYGQLEYRSLRFETEVLDGDHQGVSIMNFTDRDVPYTRVVEHKHFVYPPTELSKTVITREFPDKYDLSKVPFYPVQDDKNQKLYAQYNQEVADNVIFGGRLGTYRYYDMHQIIGQALTKARNAVK